MYFAILILLLLLLQRSNFLLCGSVFFSPYFRLWFTLRNTKRHSPARWLKFMTTSDVRLYACVYLGLNYFLTLAAWIICTWFIPKAGGLSYRHHRRRRFNPLLHSIIGVVWKFSHQTWTDFGISAAHSYSDLHQRYTPGNGICPTVLPRWIGFLDWVENLY